MNPKHIYRIAIVIIIFLLSYAVFVFSQAEPGLKRNVCCADQDGTCQDIGIISTDSRECGGYEDWDLAQQGAFCSQIERCGKGCCYINNVMLKMQKNYFECMHICDGVDEICSFRWESCDHPFPYIEDI